MTLAYEWDVFISYKRRGSAGPFVHALRDQLVAFLGNHFQPVRVFLDDQDLDNGAPAEDTLRALSRSRCVLAVWMPAYEESDWCCKEWLSMRARERALRQAGVEASLVYPVVFTQAQGGRFQVRGDEFTVKPHADITSAKLVGVRQGKKRLGSFFIFGERVAADIAMLRARIPPLDAPIPIVEPPPYQPPPIPLPGRA